MLGNSKEELEIKDNVFDNTPRGFAISSIASAAKSRKKSKKKRHSSDEDDQDEDARYGESREGKYLSAARGGHSRVRARLGVGEQSHTQTTDANAETTVMTASVASAATNVESKPHTHTGTCNPLAALAHAAVPADIHVAAQGPVRQNSSDWSVTLGFDGNSRAPSAPFDN